MYVLEQWHKCRDYTDPVTGSSNPDLLELAAENEAELVVAYWYGMLDPNMSDYALLKGDQLAYIKWKAPSAPKPEPKKMIVAVETIEGSPAGSLIHGIFATVELYEEFRKTWKPAYGYGSSVQGIETELRS